MKLVIYIIAVMLLNSIAFGRIITASYQFPKISAEHAGKIERNKITVRYDTRTGRMSVRSIWDIIGTDKLNGSIITNTGIDINAYDRNGFYIGSIHDDVETGYDYGSTYLDKAERADISYIVISVDDSKLTAFDMYHLNCRNGYIQSTNQLECISESDFSDKMQQRLNRYTPCYGDECGEPLSEKLARYQKQFGALPTTR